MNRSAVRPLPWLVLAALFVLHAGIARAQLVACSVPATAPVAVDDQAKWPGGAVVIDVLGNDYDPDGDQFAISSFSQGALGTVQFTSDMDALLYTPNGSTPATDQFTYTISDGQSSATGTVYLQNEAPPPPPPPPPAEVWIEHACNNLTCTFTAYWRNISDTPRYFHWEWSDGSSTPPNYNSRGALKSLSPGTHTVEVTVTFISGTVITAQSTVSVATPAHTCRFDAFPTGLWITTRLQELTTDDPPNQIDAYTYTWDWGDGAGEHPVDHWSVYQTSGSAYRTPGIRTVNFIIRAGGAIVGQCPQVLEFINEPPQPRVEAFSGGDGVTRPKKHFRFTPGGWDEYYNELGPWEWNFGDGAFMTTNGPTVVEHLYDRPGNYTVTLKVTDFLGAVGTIEQVITVPNDPPVVQWKFHCAGRVCAFDAAGSTDDSGVLTYTWTFGDGTPAVTAEAPTTSHTFAADQAYDVTLTVSDGTASTPLTKRVTPRAAPLAQDLVFYALPPCRVVDTRTGGRPPLASGSLNEYVIAGLCGVPADAKAIAVNATVVSPTNNGHVQIFASGTAATDASFLNFSPARSPRADNTIAALGTNGGIIVKPAVVSNGTTHFVLDVTGYFSSELTGVAPARGPMRFDRWGDYPWRIYDSRTTGGLLTSGLTRYIKARNGSLQYLPADAEAHAVVVTAINPSAGGHFVLYPSDIPQMPLAAAMNFQTSSQANGALMALGRRTDDDLALVYAAGAGGATTHFTVDTYGWFSKNGRYRYYPVTPCRALDTRLQQHGAPRLTHNASRSLQIQGNCGVPRGAKFAVVGATIINPDGAGSARIGATYDANVDAVQFAAGDTVANTVIVSLAPLLAEHCCAGDFGAEVKIPTGGGADLVVDVLGYFLPEVNQAPQAVADSVTALINTPITFNVLANDSDANGDAIKLSTTRAVFNPPGLGTATRASDTSITYTSTLSGDDGFDYEVVDTRGGVSHGHVTINVRATNAAPVASPDTATTTNISSVAIDVLANDTDPDDDALAIASVTAPSLGTAEIATDRIRYTPNEGSSGTDTFQYTVRDAFNATATGTVTVTITAPNQAPRAVEDSVTVYVDDVVNITPLVNDTDPDNDAIVLSQNAITEQPTLGVASRQSDTVITYSAGSIAGTDTFQYSITDARGASGRGTITVTVQPTCTAPPVISAQPASRAINIGESTTLSVTASGGVIPLEYQWYVGASGATATPIGINSSTLTVTPNATTSYWVRVKNACGTTNSAAAIVTVCTPPAIATQPASQSIPVGTSATLSVAAAGSGIAYQWYEGAAGVTTTPVGTNSSSFTTPVLTASKTYWVRVTSTCNGTVVVDSAAADVNVTCTGAPAIATQPASPAIDGGQAVTLSVAASEAASYQWYVGASGTTTTPIGTNSNTLNVSPVTTTQYWVAITNSCGSTASNTSTVTVCNVPGITTQPAAQAVPENTTATLTVAAAPLLPDPKILDSSPANSAPWAVSKIFDKDLTTDYASNAAGTDTFIDFDFGVPGRFTEVSFTDRRSSGGTNGSNVQGAGDNVTAFDLIFSTDAVFGDADDVKVPVTSAACCDTVVTPIDNIVARYVRYDVTAMSGGGLNAGAAELAFRAFDTVNPTGSYDYQWYEGASGVTTTPVGTNSASFTTPALSAPKSYWARVTSACNGTTANSNAAAITIACANAPVITTPPAARTIDAGQSATLTVTVSGVGPFTYQWYQGAAPSTATPVGTNSPSLTVTPSATTSYWVRVTNACGGVNSGTVIVTVCVPPSFATQPASQTVTVNSTATLSVGVNGSGPFSYQWYEGAKGVTTNPVGANSPSFTTPALTANKTYWVRVTSTCNGTRSIDSEAATITVTCATAPSITAQPVSRTVNAGQPATLSVTASGYGTLTYQWYQGTAPSTTTPVGTNSNSLTVTPGATTNYWVRVSNACGPVNSATATVTVCALPSIATHPASTTIAYNATATLTVAAGGSGPFTYQWYEGASGVTTTPVGTNSATFTTPALTANRTYWVRVTSTCNGSASVNSNAATVTVTPLQITRRQTSFALANSQTSITASWPQATQAGNLLVAVISIDKDPNGVSTWTAPSGWTHAVTSEWNNIKTSIYYIANNAGGRTSETFTVTPGYHDQILYLLEYSGVMTVNPLDKTAVSGADTNDGYLDTGYTANTVQPKELVITGLTAYTQSEFYGQMAGYTELYDKFMGWHLSSAVHERITTAIGSQGHYAAISVTGSQFVGAVATFKAANTN